LSKASSAVPDSRNLRGFSLLAWSDPAAGAADFIARLAALVPKPRVNLTRFHGVFAPADNAR
jgi:hypothetical protein